MYGCNADISCIGFKFCILDHYTNGVPAAVYEQRRKGKDDGKTVMDALILSPRRWCS